jgi:hypothetical protein
MRALGFSRRGSEEVRLVAVDLSRLKIGGQEEARGQVRGPQRRRAAPAASQRRRPSFRARLIPRRPRDQPRRANSPLPRASKRGAHYR